MLSSPSSSSPLRHEVFRAVWLAAICSYVGNWLQDVGESWTMLSLTTSPMLVAMVTTSSSVPSFLLMLPAGAMADRFDRRKILLWAQGSLVVVAAVLAAVTALKIVNPGVILIASACLGVGSALSTPPWQTLVPELVPREEMPNAVTLNSVAFNIARTVGPALGGFIIAAAGPAAVFALNALSFVAVIEVLRRYPEVKAVAAKRRSRRAQEPFFRSMRTALVYARRSGPLRALYTSAGVFSIMAASVPALLPVFAKETLHATPFRYGVLLGALGFGAVFGAFVLQRIRPLVKARNLVAMGMTIYGVSVVSMASARSFPVAVAMLVPAGVGWITSLSSLNALVQLAAPRWVRARAMGLYQLAFLATWSVGATVGGALASTLGVPGTMRVAALGTIAAAVVTAFLPLPSFSDDADKLEPEIPTPAPIAGVSAR